MTDLTPAWPAPSGRLLLPPCNRPSRRAIAFWATSAAIGWLVVLALLMIAMQLLDAYADALSVAVKVAAVLAVVHTAVMPVWRYRVHRWEQTPEAVYVRVGWLNQAWRIVPLSRVQNVDKSFGALERLFGLGSVSIETAGSHLVVEGVDRDTANRLAWAVSLRTQATPEDAT